MRLNIKIKGLPNKIEKYVISNINLSPPKCYASMQEDELNKVYQKTLETFPNYKGDLNKNIILSMRSSWIKNHMITKHKNLYINSKKILTDYKNNIDVLQISENYDVSPLNILRYVFDKIYHKKLTKIIINPDELDEHDKIQLDKAINNDNYALISHSKILSESIEFEESIQKILDSMNIRYKTQEQLVEEQIKKHGKPINTPDFLINSDLFINDFKINWIDAKNFYGSKVPFVENKIKAQTKKYLDTWGPGCIIFNLSFNDELRYPNILIADYKSF
jgi:hypothetical protein